MKLVIQRSKESSVSINNEVVGEISKGLVVLVGFTHGDSKEDLEYCVRKLSNLRIFEDEEGKMNLSIKEVGGDILSISQFTLHANTRKGNRPSFIASADPETASKLYDEFNDMLRQEGFKVETGEFGADMKVSITNDGPVTIIIDTEHKGWYYNKKRAFYKLLFLFIWWEVNF